MRSPSRAFSIFEVICAVAVIGILATVAMTQYDRISETTRSAKLQNDAQILNNAVNAYVAFGGEFGEQSTASSVLRSLKTRSADAFSQTVAGLSGSLVDPRVTFVMQTEEEAASEMSRIYWDAAAAKFRVTSEGAPAIKDVRLDEMLADSVDGTENRTTNLAYSGAAQSWVWDYEDRQVPDSRLAPTVVALTEDPTPVSTPTDPTPTVIATELAPPGISLPSGSYPAADFDLAITLTNPNPPGRSDLVYSVNLSEWLPYTGGTIAVSPDSRLRARAVPLSTDWLASPVAEESYAPITFVFSGYTDATFGSLWGKGRNPKYRLKSNNGHGNNYDGVDASNPATLRSLVTDAAALTDDEVKERLPKNGSYLASGEAVTAEDLTNGVLMGGTPFGFDTPGETFPIAAFSYHNGETIETSEIGSFDATILVNFESPEPVQVALSIQISLKPGKGIHKGKDVIELYLPPGRDWPLVKFGGTRYKIFPDFAYDGQNNLGYMVRTVPAGETRVFELRAMLEPK